MKMRFFSRMTISCTLICLVHCGCSCTNRYSRSASWPPPPPMEHQLGIWHPVATGDVYWGRFWLSLAPKSKVEYEQWPLPDQGTPVWTAYRSSSGIHQTHYSAQRLSLIGPMRMMAIRGEVMVYQNPDELREVIERGGWGSTDTLENSRLEEKP